jgi:hypothetical protein
MHPKTWTDQPGVVEGNEVLSTFLIQTPDRIVKVEIRRVDYEVSRYVTAGTMFASQTIKAEDDRAVYRILDGLSSGNETIPKGCEMVSHAPA